MSSNPKKNKTSSRAYFVEFVILIVGAITALIAALTISTHGIAVVTALLTVTVAGSTWAIRREIADRVSSVTALNSALQRIQKREWKEEAQELVDQLVTEIKEWADGRRHLPQTRSVSYQIDMLRGASKSVDAIHVALDLRSIDLWSGDSKKLRALIEAHKGLADKVNKRRIVLINDADPDVYDPEKHQIVSPEIIAFCELQTKSKSKGGFGYDLWVLLKSDIQYVEDGDVPEDVLIVDGKEALTVFIRDGEIYNTTVCVDASKSKQEKRFVRYLNYAAPASDYLPHSQSSLSVIDRLKSYLVGIPKRADDNPGG